MGGKASSHYGAKEAEEGDWADSRRANPAIAQPNNLAQRQPSSQPNYTTAIASIEDKNKNTSNTDSGRCSRTASEVSFNSVDGEDCPNNDGYPKYGYQISDLDEFLSRASLSSPGNIPVVLLTSCDLFITREGGLQQTIPLPAGMAVNAVFKKHLWLYVQTPRGHQGYVRYSCCAALGVLPPKPCCVQARRLRRKTPSWESLPIPWSDTSQESSPLNGFRNFYKADKDIKYFSDYEGVSKRRPTYVNVPRRRDAMSVCDMRRGDPAPYTDDEDALRRISARTLNCVKRQTLLVVTRDFPGGGGTTLAVKQGEVVALVHSNVKQWFWVKNRDGKQGFIPAEVAGNGFL